MRLNTTDFLRKCQHPLLLAIGSFPIALLMMVHAAPGQLLAVASLPAAYVLLSWGCLLIPGKKRIMAGILGILALIGLAVTVLPWQGRIVLFLLPAMYAMLLLITLPIGGWQRNHELNVAWPVAGMLTHLLLQLLISGADRMGSEAYALAKTPLLCSFLCYAVLVLLALNRASLDSAAQSRRTVPLLMKRQNIFITLLVLVIGVAIAAIPAIGTALGVAWDYVMHIIGLIAGLLASLMPSSQRGGSGGGGAAPDEMGFGAANEPSALAVLMEKIIGVLALVVIIIAVILLLRVAVKKLRQALKYLWNRLNQYGAAAGEDYEDEITSTRDESDTEREGLLNRLRRFGGAEEKATTPNEQVRLRYKRLRQRKGWKGADTARETLPEMAAGLYERARYGGENLTEDEAARFKEDTKRV